MSATFLLLASLTVAGALGAVLWRNPVHCALSLTLTFAALAGLYLRLNAQFAGLVQILVYIGAVAVLIVFAILLTQSSEVGPADQAPSAYSSSWWAGAAVALAFFVTVAAVILSSSVRKSPHFTRAETDVRGIGEQLLAEYVLPLEVLGLLLTAALIGAVLIALDEARPARTPGEDGSRLPPTATEQKDSPA